MTTSEAAPSPDERDDLPQYRYSARLASEIETKWQDVWEARHTFWAPNPVGALSDGLGGAEGKPKLYVLDMFPYPSGAGLHVGHPLGYIGTDVYARYWRMQGYNVLHAMGYDAFGLPAEQYAVQTGQHPRVTTEANIANMRRQLRGARARPRPASRCRDHRRRRTTGGRSGSSCRSSTPGTTTSPTGPGRSRS